MFGDRGPDQAPLGEDERGRDAAAGDLSARSPADAHNLLAASSAYSLHPSSEHNHGGPAVAPLTSQAGPPSQGAAQASISPDENAIGAALSSLFGGDAAGDTFGMTDGLVLDPGPAAAVGAHAAADLAASGAVPATPPFAEAGLPPFQHHAQVNGYAVPSPAADLAAVPHAAEAAHPNAPHAHARPSAAADLASFLPDAYAGAAHAHAPPSPAADLGLPGGDVYGRPPAGYASALPGSVVPSPSDAHPPSAAGLAGFEARGPEFASHPLAAPPSAEARQDPAPTPFPHTPPPTANPVLPGFPAAMPRAGSVPPPPGAGVLAAFPGSAEAGARGSEFPGYDVEPEVPAFPRHPPEVQGGGQRAPSAEAAIAVEASSPEPLDLQAADDVSIDGSGEFEPVEPMARGPKRPMWSWPPPGSPEEAQAMAAARPSEAPAPGPSSELAQAMALAASEVEGGSEAAPPARGGPRPSDELAEAMALALAATGSSAAEPALEAELLGAEDAPATGPGSVDSAATEATGLPPFRNAPTRSPSLEHLLFGGNAAASETHPAASTPSPPPTSGEAPPLALDESALTVLAWPLNIPEEADALSILRGEAGSPPGLEGLTQRLLATASADERQALAQPPASDADGLLQRGLATRWRLATAMATRPRDESKIDAGAAAQLVTSASELIDAFAAPVSDDPAVQATLQWSRGELVKIAVDFGEAATAFAEPTPVAEAPPAPRVEKPAPAPRPRAESRIAEPPRKPRVSREAFLRATLVVMAVIAVVFHLHRHLSARQTIPTPPGLPEGTVGGMNEKTGTTLVTVPDPSRIQAVREELMRSASAKGMVVQQIGPNTFLVLKQYIKVPNGPDGSPPAAPAPPPAAPGGKSSGGS